ncbi:MAG: Helix-turn-helix domain [Myxococcales bacterium]|nr:Helix-turn-helix domain [Myxococcales bacterium]
MSLGDLGAEIEISKGYISQLENGEDVNPTLVVLLAIAKALGTTLADLLEEPKTRARGEIPSDLPSGLRELMDDRRKSGDPLDQDIVFWLANAQFRGDRPETKQDFEYLLRSLKSSVSGIDEPRRKKRD